MLQMKPSQGLVTIVIGFVIALLSSVPTCVAFFALDASFAGEEWGTGILLLYSGIAGLIFGHAIMAIGVFLTAAAAYIENAETRFVRPRSRQRTLEHSAK